MASLPPPPGPPTLPATMDDNPLYRVHFRLWQISLSAITVLVSGYFWTLGPLPGLTASFLGKHVLVAILAAGLDLPEVRSNKKG